MRTEKRWLKQVLKEVVGKHIEMPWKHSKRPAAFTDLNRKDQLNVA